MLGHRCEPWESYLYPLSFGFVISSPETGMANRMQFPSEHQNT
jgi:hypothetical protein